MLVTLDCGDKMARLGDLLGKKQCTCVLTKVSAAVSDADCFVLAKVL